MPKNTKVDRIYQAIKKRTGDKGLAAATAQKITGKSLATGRRPKSKKK
jgi:hypothetical protein